MNSWGLMIDGRTLRQLNDDHRARLAWQWGRRGAGRAGRGRQSDRAAGRRVFGRQPARACEGAAAAADPVLLCAC